MKFKKLNPEAILPRYAHDGDAGMDLFSTEECVLNPGERVAIGTGLALEIPYGFELQIRPRSGMAIKHGISMVNSPGTIDYGFRGELKILLINFGQEEFEIKKGDKIAQAIVNRVELVEIIEAEDLAEAERGDNGLGSTGKN